MFAFSWTEGKKVNREEDEAEWFLVVTHEPFEAPLEGVKSSLDLDVD